MDASFERREKHFLNWAPQAVPMWRGFRNSQIFGSKSPFSRFSSLFVHMTHNVSTGLCPAELEMQYQM